MASAIETNYDDLNGDELSSIDTSLLMAFLEDGGDDGMFPSTIEATDLESCSETSSEESCSASPLHHNPDFEWIDDMEMDYSFPSYNEISMDGYYYIAPYTENMGKVGGLEDYTQTCYGMSMEEDGYIGLWQ